MRIPLIIIGVALLFVGGIFLAIGGRTVFDDWRYGRQAVRAEAVAIGKSLRYATEASNTAYELSYRAVLDGKSYERTDAVPVRLWERIEPGSGFEVEYLPGQPESVRAVRDAADENTASILWAALGAVLVLGAVFALVAAVRLKTTAAPEQDPSPSTDAVHVSDEPSYWHLARRSAVFWLGAIFLAVGMPMFVGLAAEARNDWRFSRDAVATQGVVLTKEMKRSGKGNRKKKYEATYRFTAGESSFENRTRLSSDGWAQLKERQPAAVLYLPSDPSTNHLAGPRPWLSSSLISLLGLLFAGIGGTFFARAVKNARLEWRLRREGARAQGTITELRDRHLEIDGVRQWRLHYDYRDYQGRQHVGTADMSEEDAHQWKVGDVGNVLYDSRQPAQAIWLGRSDSAFSNR